MILKSGASVTKITLSRLFRPYCQTRLFVKVSENVKVKAETKRSGESVACVQHRSSAALRARYTTRACFSSNKCLYIYCCSLAIGAPVREMRFKIKFRVPHYFIITIIGGDNEIFSSLFISNVNTGSDNKYCVNSYCWRYARNRLGKTMQTMRLWKSRVRASETTTRA